MLMLMATSVYTVLQNYKIKETKAASLAVFRFLFGLILLISIIRFWYKGWIEKLYLEPAFHFHYTGFEFINVPGRWTYLAFIICGLSALMFSLGWKYRWAIVVFFLSFTYIELLDKTTYLNHYYFVSVMSFLLIFLPAHCTFSVDAIRNEKLRAEYIPSWSVDVLKLMLAIVYLYAGLAKLNYDWLVHAMPLSIWLPTKFEVPFLGSLMHEKWMHYLFSWGGAVYDLFIVFFLMLPRTRKWAFAAVVLFHLMTRILFPIGMFPYIMIISTMIFFSPEFHEKVVMFFSKISQKGKSFFKNGQSLKPQYQVRWAPMILGCMIGFQILFPLRGLAYSDNIYWTEQGYRYSWRVMLMEKTGYANFKIVNGQTKKRFYVQNDDFLTILQQKQMSTQPDFILEYAKYLGKHFESQGHEFVEVYVESFVALNGRKSQSYLDTEVDLMQVTYKELCQSHLIPMNE